MEGKLFEIVDMKKLKDFFIESFGTRIERLDINIHIRLTSADDLELTQVKNLSRFLGLATTVVLIQNIDHSKLNLMDNRELMAITKFNSELDAAKKLKKKK